MISTLQNLSDGKLVRLYSDVMYEDPDQRSQTANKLLFKYNFPILFLEAFSRKSP